MADPARREVRRKGVNVPAAVVLAIACIVFGVVELVSGHREIRGAGVLMVGVIVLVAVAARASRS